MRRMEQIQANVLMVEDSAPLAAVYQAYLKHEPLALTVVSSGQAAMEVIRRQPPDILLLDAFGGGFTWASVLIRW